MEQIGNRSRDYLLNLAAGGDGHLSDWIERATYEATADAPETEVYILHMPPKRQPNGRLSNRQQYVGTLEHCRKFLLLPYIERDDAPDIDSIPYEDTGRRIPAEQQQPYGSLRIYD